jgi:hypothetical protein
VFPRSLFLGNLLDKPKACKNSPLLRTRAATTLFRLRRQRGVAFGESAPSPERVNDGSCGHKRDFALLHPLEYGGEVSPTTPRLLPVIDNTSFAFIDLGQDETHVAGRGRVDIHRVRELRRLGHVVAQESFLSGAVVRRLHPRGVALKRGGRPPPLDREGQ